MSADPTSIERSFSERLSEFDRKIKAQDDNASLLNEIHSSLTALYAQSGDSDEEIREILQRRYNSGKLRLETYQLVRNVLDRVVIESMATMPGDADSDDSEDSYRETMVITGRPVEQEARQDHLQIGSVLRDRFLLQERVSGGSMGVVYKAHDRRLAEADGFDPWVAIKVLSPKLSRNAHALRALQQEAAKGRCLSHPNIVRFIDLDRDDDVYFIVMEWLEGRSLAAVLDENKNARIDLKTSLDIVRQVGLALDYAHRCGVVHADVKPANIMLTPAGQVKLFDFGIARIRQKQHDARNSFDPGVLGAITPAYSSMQVLTGEDPAPTDDVFSLGCLMYRLVAGHRVFGPRNAAEAAESGMEPQRPAGLSDQQWRALKKALAYSRVARFATPAEFLEALDDEENGPARAQNGMQAFDDVFGGPLVVEPKARPPERRHYWPIAIAFLALVAVALALVAQPELLGRVQVAGRSLIDRLAPAPAPEEGAPAVAGAPAAEPGEPGERSNPGPGTPDDIVNAPIQTLPPVENRDPVTADQRSAPAEGAVPPPDDGAQEPVEQDPLPTDEAPLAGVDTPAQEPAANALPAADVVVALDASRAAAAVFDLSLREGEGALVLDLVRQANVDEELVVQIEETAYNSEVSPVASGRLQISNDGTVDFSPGQRTARVTMSLLSDNARAEDIQARFSVRDVASADGDFAVINLNLQDDDQRHFEATLPQNTVGFTRNQLYVNERDPALQVDVVRYNPGQSELEVRYFVAGGSAVEDEDFFLPGSTGLVFAPGQRFARLLIPLVQDSILEADETLVLELRTDRDAPQANIFRRIEVIIRDDDD